MSNNHLNELTTATLKHNREIIHLFLAGNRLRALPRDIFSHLKYLTEVQLEYNQLREFSHLTFSRTNKFLLSIQMNHNNISFLHDHMFVPLQKLERIDLSANRIQNISDKLFRQNSNGENPIQQQQHQADAFKEENAFKSQPKLEELHLDDNHLYRKDFLGRTRDYDNWYCKNKIKSIDDESFAEDFKLEELLLDNNKLSDFDAFSSSVFKNLKILNLANNNLINAYRLETLTSLTHLLLQNNQLKNLNFQVHVFCTNLTTLNCSNNRITEMNLMQISYYTKMKTLNLSINPILIIKNEEELMDKIFTNLQFQPEIDVNTN